MKTYCARERFFHFEFFRTPDGRIIALEVNMRPPGGLTTDMWNYANDINIYREYANVIVHNQFEAQVSHPYFCAYFGRRNQHTYTHPVDEVVRAFPGKVCHSEPVSGVFASAIGDYGILVRSPELEEIEEMAGFILEREDGASG